MSIVAGMKYRKEAGGDEEMKEDLRQQARFQDDILSCLQRLPLWSSPANSTNVSLALRPLASHNTSLLTASLARTLRRTEDLITANQISTSYSLS